jgi:hypothetical protein
VPELKPGDRIRFKKVEGRSYRINGALDLTLAYLGTEHVIYTWAHPKATESSGEVHVSRSEFDEQIEAMPEVFEEGHAYTNEADGNAEEWSCVFADDEVAVLAVDDRRKFRTHVALDWWKEAG